MKFLRVTLLSLPILLLAISVAQAVPSLGVGSSTGYVNATGTDPYQTYWGPSLPGTGDGFAIGPSGSALHVFTNITGADIYILTTSDVFTGNNIKFDGSVNKYDVTDPFRSYMPIPYYGIDLGPVNNTWASLTKPPFEPGIFNSKDVAVTYTGQLADGHTVIDGQPYIQWIFAAADDNGLSGLQTKTTTVWNDVNGLPGIQLTETTEWIESNGLGGIQEKGGKISTCTTRNGKPGCWVTFKADTSTTYEADTFTNVQGDSSSPKTTSARGFNVPEPSSLLLLGGGLIGLACWGRKRFRG